MTTGWTANSVSPSLSPVDSTGLHSAYPACLLFAPTIFVSSAKEAALVTTGSLADSTNRPTPGSLSLIPLLPTFPFCYCLLLTWEGHYQCKSYAHLKKVYDDVVQKEVYLWSGCNLGDGISCVMQLYVMDKMCDGIICVMQLIMCVIGLSLKWDHVCEGGCNPGDGTERLCQGCPWICLSDSRGEMVVLDLSGY